MKVAVKPKPKKVMPEAAFVKLQEAAIECIQKADIDRAERIVAKMKGQALSREQYQILFAEVFLLASRGLVLHPDANEILAALVEADVRGMVQAVSRLIQHEILIDDGTPTVAPEEPLVQPAMHYVDENAPAAHQMTQVIEKREDGTCTLAVQSLAEGVTLEATITNTPLDETEPDVGEGDEAPLNTDAEESVVPTLPTVEAVQDDWE